MNRHIHIHFFDHLEQSSSKADISKNIKTEEAAGKPQKQAVAIAESVARSNDADFDESKHKRGPGGQFGSGGKTAVAKPGVPTAKSGKPANKGMAGWAHKAAPQKLGTVLQGGTKPTVASKATAPVGIKSAAGKPEGMVKKTTVTERAGMGKKAINPIDQARMEAGSQSFIKNALAAPKPAGPAKPGEPKKSEATKPTTSSGGEGPNPSDALAGLINRLAKPEDLSAKKELAGATRSPNWWRNVPATGHDSKKSMVESVNERIAAFKKSDADAMAAMSSGGKK